MLDSTPLSEADRDHFDTQGYLIVRQALEQSTIQTLLAAGDRLLASDLRTGRQQAPDRLYDGFRNTIALDDAFVPLIDHATILPTVVQLLGADLQVMTSHLIHRQPDPPDTPPGQRRPGWHRDYAMAMDDMGHRAIPRLLVKCAYYLTDLSQPSRGATMVAPGSHLLDVPPETTDDGDPAGAVEPSLQPGDCLIFENRTFHAGAIHLGPDTRKVIMIGYGYRWVVPIDYRTQSREFITRLTPLQRFLVGEPYADVAEFQVHGGQNPLKEWCEEHGFPTARHPQAQGTE
ncbi:MAG TPA: phytanoyl-CoA dioxygenase family protein [Candidatus Latescibacteria bacterium]|nr:hypothetical protein [Gemmatimonadaceae bacterium]MDP6016667.1 phytanoyl-CoA dioxygenase family protein [Candidatus Latescibacterota bacterium]HJP31716.1 phytanoyl-CoA dioxygenase family protein [Candidatus Latescibacterota bacterium]